MSGQVSTKRRKLPGPSGTGYTARVNSTFITDDPSHPEGYWFSHPKEESSDTRDTSGAQYTVSEGHRWPPPKGGGLSDLGGNFFTQKSYIASGGSYSNLRVRLEGGFSQVEQVYGGPIYPYWPADERPPFPPPAASSDDDLAEAGATAIARCKPTNSVADLATALGEGLKDGLPRVIGSELWRDRTLTAKNAGSEYLNAQFGWLPLLSDITDTAKAIRHNKEILDQYYRDVGNVVRRQYPFPSTSDTSELVMSSHAFANFSPQAGIFLDGSDAGRLVRRRETTRKRWFSGAFTYYLPSGFDSRKRLDRLSLEADKLFGITPTPETLWNIAPWSWAVDWFSNTGDVISNLQDFATGGLVMRYGYIMEHTVVQDTYSLDSGGLHVQCRQPIEDLVLVTETKKRLQANPFGFGVSWNGLSSFQASILAALGITRRG